MPNKLFTEEKARQGASELVALGDSIDPELNEYMDLITDWAIRTRDKHHLSPEALTMLIHTAPSAQDAFEAKMMERLVRKAGEDNA